MKHDKVFCLKAGIVSGLVVLSVVVAMVGVSYLQQSVDERVLEWHTVAVITPDMLILGENDPGAGASGWLATFCLDYAETPSASLASNSSHGDYDSWDNVSGYVDADDTDTDLKSEDPFYFVVRARFNATVKDGEAFVGSRCKVTLTVAGDETIGGVAQQGDDDGSDNNGGGIPTFNDTGGDFIYINFYWDDNDDGYRITDDGTLTWSITIEAKY